MSIDRLFGDLEMATAFAKLQTERVRVVYGRHAPPTYWVESDDVFQNNEDCGVTDAVVYDNAQDLRERREPT